MWHNSRHWNSLVSKKLSTHCEAFTEVKCWWNIDWKISLIYERHLTHTDSTKMGTTKRLANCLWMNHWKKNVLDGKWSIRKMINQKWRVPFFGWTHETESRQFFKFPFARISMSFHFCPPIIRSANWIILLYVFLHGNPSSPITSRCVNVERGERK